MVKKYKATIVQEMNGTRAQEVVAHANSVEEAVQQIKDRFGPIRTWWSGPKEEITEQESEE
jgi:hypothetical protein